MRRIALVLSVAAVVAMLALTAVPAMGAVAVQEQKKEEEKKEEKGKEEKKEEKKDLPKSGGITGNEAALVGLGAAALLVGGGFLVRKAVR